MALRFDGVLRNAARRLATGRPPVGIGQRLGLAVLNVMVGRAIPFVRRNGFRVTVLGPGRLTAVMSLVRQESWRGPAGESPVQVSRSGRLVTSVA